MQLELDRYFSFLTRRISHHYRSHRIIELLRKYFLKKYRNSKNSWTVINDFDGNLKFKLDRSAYLGGLIYWRGYQSLDELIILDKLLKPSMTFVDIGANQGEYTIFAAKRLTQGKVFAFEPLQNIYNHLQENIALNQFNNIITYNYALSDKNGYATMFTSKDLEIHHSFNEGLSSLFKSNYRATEIEKVKITVFDQIVNDEKIKKIDLIKIDVEGAELLVLEGGICSIKRDNPMILLEINDDAFESAGYTTKELIGFLKNLQYRFYQISYRGNIIPIDVTNLPQLCNLLCLHKTSNINFLID
jgi:FkbM family methyltransferase